MFSDDTTISFMLGRLSIAYVLRLKVESGTLEGYSMWHQPFGVREWGFKSAPYLYSEWQQNVFSQGSS